MNSTRDIVEGFGDRLRALRERRGITQEQLAALAGVSQPLISFAESGRRGISHAMLIRLADALRVSVGELSGEKRGRR